MVYLIMFPGRPLMMAFHTFSLLLKTHYPNMVPRSLSLLSIHTCHSLFVAKKYPRFASGGLFEDSDEDNTSNDNLSPLTTASSSSSSIPSSFILTNTTATSSSVTTNARTASFSSASISSSQSSPSSSSSSSS